ncbi:MAG: RNA polymerase sigma factor [Candidatus Sumerlaeaceae bacterium]|nr:RNA polymerase sigma factor [Candidatus Sumerlaeaceae bacterium]
MIPEQSIPLEHNPAADIRVVPLGQEGDGPAAVVDAADTALIERTLAGDNRALDALIRRHEHGVYVHAYRILRSREDTEDAVQETFLRVVRGLGTFRPGAPFRPWLYSIATNTAITALRRRKTRPVMTDMEEPQAVNQPDPRAADPADVAASRETAERLEAALARLAPAEVALFNLRYREGMPLQQIASALGRTAGAVAVALHRLRLHLRRALEVTTKADAGKESDEP